MSIDYKCDFCGRIENVDAVNEVRHDQKSPLQSSRERAIKTVSLYVEGRQFSDLSLLPIKHACPECVPKLQIMMVRH